MEAISTPIYDRYGSLFSEVMEKYSSAELFPLVVKGIVKSFHVVHDQSVPPDMTIGDLKKSVIEKLGISRGFTRPVADPELFVLVVLGSDGFPLSEFTKDDAQSLRCYLSDSGYFSSSNANQFPINLEILEGYTWESTAKSYAHLKKWRERERNEVDDRYYYYSDSDDSVGSIEEERFEGVFDRESPLNTLEENRNILRVVGRLHVEWRDNGTIKRRAVPYLGGLGCDLKDVVKMDISADCVVFLVSTTLNLNLLSQYHACLDQHLSIDPNDKMLVLFVTSDKFSYLLLKMLRKSIGPDVPIVAVTDSIILELDLLAFLDTPAKQVDSLYNCELSQVCADLELTDVAVDIKWAGLRPSEIMDNSVVPFIRDLLIAADTNDLLCDFLELHPKLAGKQKWLQELKHFRDKRVYVDPTYSPPNTPPDFTFLKHFMKTYFPLKLVNKDWI